MTISMEESNLYGWDVIIVESGLLKIGIAPDIGGRIISIQVDGEELLFHQKEHAGETFHFGSSDDRKELKRSLGFRLWGGDKTWVAPQEAWWEGIPPIDLDAGVYELEKSDEIIRLKSPICPETGIRIIREISLKDEGRMDLNQIFVNDSENIIKKGIWDVTQFLRSMSVFIPTDPEKIRGYPNEGDSVTLHPHYVKPSSHGWSEIKCGEPVHFKFGSMLDRGVIMAVHPLKDGFLLHGRRFNTVPDSDYAHRAVVEVYNSPTYDYLELEIHAPFLPIQPKGSVSHSQEWFFKKIDEMGEPETMWELLESNQ